MPRPMKASAQEWPLQDRSPPPIWCTETETDVTELSTLDSLADADFQFVNRKGGARYDVETISLLDFLASAKSPTDIDYMSIDIEGGEYEVLNNFDFSKYNIKLISVEHNYSDMRQEIQNILSNWGYRSKFTTFFMFDNCYVKCDVK